LPSPIVPRIEIEAIDAGAGSIPCVRSALPAVNLAAWSRAHRSWIDDELFRSGAVLFRGFDVEDAPAFSSAAHEISGPLFADYGDLPRNQAGGQIYESTPYRADERILFHNESSHMPSWPMRIHFYCAMPATRGGSTPIVDTRKILELLSPDVFAEFAAKGLLYVRNFVDGVEPTWQRFFGTDDRAEVERACRRNGSSFAWRSDGGLAVSQRTSAVSRHSVTGEQIFFNQIQLHHISLLDEDVRDGLLAMFGHEGLPRNVYFGDGSPIPDEIVAHLSGIYDRICKRFEWERNDVIVLDNMLAAHGRDSYGGERRILVALAQMTGARASSGKPSVVTD
jgi:alpha-ketoglutarate-dependent taurine dioxygenase